MSTPFNAGTSRTARSAAAVSARARFGNTWAGLATRERFLVGTAAALVVLALLWWVAIGPALETLRTADAKHRVLDAELQTMRSLAAEAVSLQGLPRVRPEDGRRALEASVKQRLGPASQMSVMGDRATVTLKDTPPEALTEWLSQVRSNARAVATDARLTLNPARTGWDGTVVLALPSL